MALKKMNERDFRAGVEAVCVRLGGRMVENDTFRQYELDTAGGKVKVAAMDNWVACRFDDPSLARRFACGPTVNQFSGKWNFHGSDNDRAWTLFEFDDQLTRMVNLLETLVHGNYMAMLTGRPATQAANDPGATEAANEAAYSQNERV